MEIKKKTQGIIQLNEDVALGTMKMLLSVFERRNVFYTLSGGTLLGAVRSNSFIPWDTGDIDINICYEDVDTVSKIINDLIKEGYKVTAHKPSRQLEMEKEGFPHIDFVLFRIPKLLLILSNLFLFLPKFMRMGVIRFSQETYFKSEFLRPTDSYKRDQKLIRCRIVQLMKILFFNGNKKRSIVFYDFKVTIPYKSEELLELYYGRDWKVPKKKFVSYVA